MTGSGEIYLRKPLYYPFFNLPPPPNLRAQIYLYDTKLNLETPSRDISNTAHLR